MGFMDKLLGSSKEFPPLNKDDPAAQKIDAMRQPVEKLVSEIKDPIEVLGVPHCEVDLILVNNESVGFDYKLKDGDRVAVYPVFESFDISPLQRLRPKPLRKTAFIVDVNLGKLARALRMLGFDAAYGNRLKDHEIVDIIADALRGKRRVAAVVSAPSRVVVVDHGRIGSL